MIDRDRDDGHQILWIERHDTKGRKLDYFKALLYRRSIHASRAFHSSMSRRQLFNSNRIRQWRVKFYKNLGTALNFLENVSDRVTNQTVSPLFVSCLNPTEGHEEISPFFLLSQREREREREKELFHFRLFNHPLLQRLLSYNWRIHISFDLDALILNREPLVLAIRGKGNARETRPRPKVWTRTTLIEYSSTFWPTKLHSYPAPCQRPRIQRKVEARCGGGRPLPFYHVKGETSGHLNATPSIRESSKKRFQYAISIQNKLAAWPKISFRTLWRSPLFSSTSRRDTTYRLILIIAPRRRDASNRLPHHGQQNPIAIDRVSINRDH